LTTQTDTSTDNKGRLKLAAGEPVIQRARVCGRCCWCGVTLTDMAWRWRPPVRPLGGNVIGFDALWEVSDNLSNARLLFRFD